MMKKIVGIVAALVFSTSLYASENSAKGLNVLLTSSDTQTQMMAMVLSMKTLKQGKSVNMVLCSKAGDLADKNEKSKVLKPINKSPKQLLKAIMKKGASVKVCPLYLPNASKKKSVLLEGITVAKPDAVAASLLDKDFKNLSY